MSSPRYAVRRWWRRTSGSRPATMSGWIVAVTLVVYCIEVIAPVSFASALAYRPADSLPAVSGQFEPWRMLTVLLVHDRATVPYGLLALTHVGFNMYMLYAFGRPLENVIGGARLLAIYVIAGLGSSVAVLYAGLVGILQLGGYVVGASGAVFGVFAATAVIQRRLGGDVRYLYVIVGLNFALAFVIPGIAWEAHIGGLLVGALVGWLLFRNRGPRRRSQAIGGALAITAALIMLAVLPAVLGYGR